MARVRRYVRGGVRHDLRILQHVHNVLVHGFGLHRLRADGGSDDGTADRVSGALDGAGARADGCADGDADAFCVADDELLRAPCGHVVVLVRELL